MNPIETNLDGIKNVHYQMWRMLSAVEPVNYRTEASRAGEPTLIWKTGNQDFYIHSKFNPAAEAVKLVGKHDLNNEHIILFGLGLGYHLEQIMLNKAPDARVLLVEPDIEIVYHSLNYLNWAALLNRPDFFYFVGGDTNVLASTVEEFVNVVTFDRLEVINLPSEVRFNAEFFGAAQELIDNEIRSLLYDFKTRIAEQAVVPRNVLKNTANLLHTRPVRALKEKFKGSPAIIVSAGPSLDKNIFHLKKIRDRAVIICVDTALKPLLNRGIQPHFTVTADPSFKNYLHLQGTETGIRYFLAAETGISTQVYKDFSKHIFTVSLGKPIVKMLEQNIGEIGEVDAWGSVISLAVNFAIYMGLGPIVFLGQDFAFTGMRNHCRGTSWEEKWLEDHSDLDQLQRKERSSITGNTSISEAKDIYGNPAMTSDRLLLYKNYMAKIVKSYPGCRFINSSEGGIFSEIPAQPFYRVMQEYIFPAPVLDIDALFDIPVLYNPRSKTKLNTFLKGKLNFFKKYRNKVDAYNKETAEPASMPLGTLEAFVRRSDDLKNQLYGNVQNGDIVELWSQGPIYDFLRRSHQLEKKKNAENLPPHTVNTELAELYRDYFTKLHPLLANIASSFEDSINSLRD